MNKKRYSYETLREAALFMIKNRGTLRQTQKKFRISKSTLHKFIQKDLKERDHELYLKAQELFNQNKSERAIRGGRATREKYLKLRQR